MVLDTALRHAWADTLDVLGAGAAGSVLLIGAGVEALGDELAPPVGDAVAGFVVLGAEQMMIPDGATAASTGLPDAAFDAVVALEAWRRGATLEAVAAEAARISRPGGSVWLGQRDYDRLARSEPATYRASMLYRRDSRTISAARAGLVDQALLGVQAVRAGLRPVEAIAADLPTAQYDSLAEYVESVRRGAWAGIEVLDEAEADAVLEDLARTLRPPRRFPIVERQPWSLVRGSKPT
jgi:SAM-dependent methyltransferase